jgi:hypothetical protein
MFTRRSPGCRATCSACAWSAATVMSMRLGNADYAFSIMSVSEPFVFALV